MPDHARVIPAHDETDEIERVAAQIAHGARAGARLYEAPHARRIAARQAPSLKILHIDVVYPADFPLLDQLAGTARRGLEAVGEAHHVWQPLFGRGLREYIGFCGRHGDRLFHVIRLAGLDRRHRDLKMRVIRRADVHSVHVRAANQVAVVRKPVRLVDAVLFAHGAQLFRVDVADCHKLEIGAAPDTRLVHARPDCAHTDRADADNLLFHTVFPFCTLKAFFQYNRWAPRARLPLCNKHVSPFTSARAGRDCP